LSSIELYAVRYLEDIAPVDVEAVAAAAIATIQQEEWDVAAIEKRKEQQEAEAEDSEEAIEGWDKVAADAAYQRYQEEVAAEVAAAEAAAAAAAELTPDFTPGTSYAWGGEGGEFYGYAEDLEVTSSQRGVGGGRGRGRLMRRRADMVSGVVLCCDLACWVVCQCSARVHTGSSCVRVTTRGRSSSTMYLLCQRSPSPNPPVAAVSWPTWAPAWMLAWW
jgi:hypothetical protein